MKDLLTVLPENTKIKIKVINKKALFEELKPTIGNLFCAVVTAILTNYSYVNFWKESEQARDLSHFAIIIALFFMAPSIMGICQLFEISFDYLAKSEKFYKEITINFEKDVIFAADGVSKGKFSYLECLSQYLEIDVKQTYLILEDELLKLKYQKEDSESKLSKLAFQLKD